MAIIYWIIIGALCGLATKFLIRDSGRGMIVDVGLGVAGAVIVGFLFNVAMVPRVGGLSVYDGLAAVVGAAIALGGYHFLEGKRPI